MSILDYFGLSHHIQFFKELIAKISKARTFSHLSGTTGPWLVHFFRCRKNQHEPNPPGAIKLLVTKNARVNEFLH